MRFDRALRIGVVTTLGLTALVVGAPALAPAGAAAGHTVVSAPATELLDSQFVTLTWTGFPASNPPLTLEAVSISECKAAPVNPMTDCAPSVSGVSDRAGGGIASLQIHTGNVLAENNVTKFTCSHTTPCSIAVYLDPAVRITPPVVGYPTATTPIAFAFPADDCPHGGAGINGTGGEAVNRAMVSWQASVCQPPTSLDLQYTRTESTDGKEAFIGQPGFPVPDFAVTSVPFSAADLAALKAKKRTFGYAPVAASGLVFAFHGTDRVTGQPLTHLTLTPSALAHIFNGTRYSMPTAAFDAESHDIIDLNPGTNFWPNLLAFGRLDGAAGSLEATSFFLSAAPTAWKEVPPYVADRSSRNGGPSEVVDYDTPTENMPDGLEGPGATNQLLNGPDILAVTLAGKGQGVGNDSSTLNIGYLDASTAAFYGLPSVCIQMDPNWRTTHTPCVNATPQSIAAALSVAKRNADGTVTPNWNPSNRAAYPVLDVSYLVAPTNQGSTAKARVLQKLIQFAVAHGPSSGVVPPGYADLPSDLSKGALTVAGAVTNAPPAPPKTTPPATTPPPTTPIVPFDPGPGFVGGTNDFGAGSLGSDFVNTPTTVAPSAVKPTPEPKPAKPKPADESIVKVAFAKAGDQISGHASWAILIALTLFCLLGLLFRPIRELPWIDKRLSWFRFTPSAAHAVGRDVMTAVQTPIESAPTPATDADPAATPGTDHRDPPGPATYLVVGALVLVVLLGVFQYWVTSVEESRSQSELLRALKTDLASTADGGVPAPAAIGRPIGLFEIPAIGLEKVAVEGSSARRVEQGPGHAPASARPGEAGDALFVGRRTSYGAPFAHLNRLHDGDTISITTARGRFTYRVDRSATRASARSGRGTLTLATSAPGLITDRVVTVTAVLQGKPLLLGTKVRALQPVPLTSIGGWFSDSSAWFWIVLWGGLLVLVLFVAARAYRTTSTRITYLLTTPVIVALLFCTLGALDRLVPVTR